MVGAGVSISGKRRYPRVGYRDLLDARPGGHLESKTTYLNHGEVSRNIFLLTEFKHKLRNRLFRAVETKTPATY